jgi:hypothetical protein
MSDTIGFYSGREYSGGLSWGSVGPWKCPHCGGVPFPDGGPHWCEASAREAAERKRDEAITYLKSLGYEVIPPER